MNNSQLQERLRKELDSFQGLWKGGFKEGDPLDPMSPSSYKVLGYMSVLHVVYLVCIKPYVNRETVALEIGPGRGSWTRALLGAKEIWCLDALSAQHNNFYEYIGNAPHVKYFQISDFSCDMLPEGKFDYFFSFAALCHVSFDGIREYMKNVYPKLKAGANCFILVADYEKYNLALEQTNKLSVINAAIDNFALKWSVPFLKQISRLFWKYIKVRSNQKFPAGTTLKMDEDNAPTPGRWYHAGLERTCQMLQDIGYRIIDPDVGVVYRDPVIHFAK